MGYPIKLKTGFFKTHCCNLEVREKGILFQHLPDKPFSDIQIPYTDLLEFSISQGTQPELEITTRDQVYICIIECPVSIPALAEELFVKSRKQIRIEEERK